MSFAQEHTESCWLHEHPFINEVKRCTQSFTNGFGAVSGDSGVSIGMVGSACLREDRLSSIRFGTRNNYRHRSTAPDTSVRTEAP